MMVKVKLLMIITLLGLSACGGGGGDDTRGSGGSSGAGAGGGSSAWIFSEDNFDFGITNIVSPDAVVLSDGSLRLYTTELGSIGVYAAAAPSNGDLSFAVQSAGVSTPSFASDPTLIQLSNGSWRMYYVDHSTPGGPERVLTATSSDGLAFSAEADTGIANTGGGQAWGVPDSVELPDGRIRIYWVDTVAGMTKEVIKSAISSDGTSFTEEPGYRTTGGYVDPHILKAVDGDWLALFSTTPGTELQTLHVGTSSDGLTWSVDSNPIISVSGGNALDPTAIDLGNGSYRIYYVATTTADASTGFYLKSGVLSKP